MNAPTQRWPGFKYEQVPGLANRLISRYLRAQRKNMKRFFEERGLYVLADRMNQIRNSRQGMMAKNRYFQEVLNEYSKLVNPVVAPSVPGAVLQSPPAAEAPGQANNP
jgi:hypothetical protein